MMSQDSSRGEYGAVGPVSAVSGGRQASWARKLAYAAAGSVALVGAAAVLATGSAGGQIAPRSLAAVKETTGKLAIMNETTGKLFCQSPCTPRLVHKEGDVAAHRDKGGVCWDLGFKADVASAAECQQECVATDGCKMWDYRAKRADKRCNFCSTTAPGAGETSLWPAPSCAWRPQLLGLQPLGLRLLHRLQQHSRVARSGTRTTAPASAVYRLVSAQQRARPTHSTDILPPARSEPHDAEVVEKEEGCVKGPAVCRENSGVWPHM